MNEIFRLLVELAAGFVAGLFALLVIARYNGGAKEFLALLMKMCRNPIL